ncbi:MAG: preprotein translocase subunit SecE [Patescibacteria group bacterium]
MVKFKLPIFSFFHSVVDEGKKVVWPDRQLVVRHTVMVIISVALATLIFASIDLGLQKLVVLAISRQ